MAIAKSKELSKVAVEVRRPVPKATGNQPGPGFNPGWCNFGRFGICGLEPNIGAKRGAIDLLT